MNIERLLDRPIFGYRSILGIYRWTKVIKSIIKSNYISLNDKLWCLKYGFSPDLYILFGEQNLKENHKDYLSTRDYNKLHPINGMFSLWIDDKLTLKHVFSKFGEYFPPYYFDIENGKALKLTDCPDFVSEPSFAGVIQLLKAKKKLALKSFLGSYGIGFYRLEFKNDDYYITGKKTSEEELIQLLKSLNHYIVTDFIVNHEVLRNIWPDATNTVRLLIGCVDEEPILLRSFIRFGNAKSNGVDNAHAGGIEAIIDEETGKILFVVAIDVKGAAKKIDKHPDSGASFDIQIPRWEETVGKCKQICRAYPELRYWGFDVVITPDSFKILEINSLSGLMAAQLKEPLMKDPKTRKVFESFGLKA